MEKLINLDEGHLELKKHISTYAAAQCNRIPNCFAGLKGLKTKEVTTIFSDEEPVGTAFALKIAAFAGIKRYPVFVIMPGVDPKSFDDLLLGSYYGEFLSQISPKLLETDQKLCRALAKLFSYIYVTTSEMSQIDQIGRGISRLSAAFPAVLVLDHRKHPDKSSSLSGKDFFSKLKRLAIKLNLAVLVVLDSKGSEPDEIKEAQKENYKSHFIEHVDRALILAAKNDENIVDVIDYEQASNNKSSFKLRVKSSGNYIKVIDYFEADKSSQIRSLEISDRMNIKNSPDRITSILDNVIRPICNEEELNGYAKIEIGAWTRNRIPEKLRFTLIVGCAASGLDEPRFRTW
ncbi:hypothetical protein [Anaerotardibacter muris]|uniref:hypothetical protein n=1 Tax=Anaerotardibacter muris TaxID=2941505 RepID=UPI00204012E9|nr:hypothetical protein [Anaerotardibacter muris]